MGGFGASAPLNSLQIYTVSSNTWAAGAALPVAVAFPQVTPMTVGGVDYIYLAGGLGSTAQIKTYRYNIAANTWSTVADMPSSRWSGGSGVVNGTWVLAGGYVNGVPGTERRHL